MDIKNFVLSHYKNSTEDFYIRKLEDSVEAKKPHTHSFFQIYYVKKGSITHFLENESSRLGHGDMFIIPPGTVHYIASKPNTVFYAFSFTPDFLTEQNDAKKLVKNFLRSLQSNNNPGIRPKVTLSTEESFHVEDIMEHISKELKQKPLAYGQVVQSYAELLVSILARSYFEAVRPSVPDHFENNKQFVLHSVEYVENNFTEQLSLDEIAKRAVMSKQKFCSLFLDLTGHSFHDYLNLCRIKKSTEYIKQGYKITAIYGLCGYNDFSTFYRNFKKIMGVSPQQYKKIHECI